MSQARTILGRRESGRERAIGGSTWRTGGGTHQGRGWVAAAVALLGVSFAGGLSAQERPNPFELDPILVVGTIDDARLSTGSARVIGTAELRRFEYSNIHSILLSAPGVYVREEDGFGTFPRIGIRASSSGRSDRISIMEDGIPAAMAPYANTSAYYFPAAGRMSGVEILKGPEILRYGPQTTSGAINLLSTPIPDSASGFANIETGAWGSRRIHSWAGGNFGAFGILAETYQTLSEGFQKIDRSTRAAGNDISDLMLKLRWRGGDETGVRQQVELKLFRGDERADVSYLGLTDADFRANPDRRYGLSELEQINRGRETASLRHTLLVGGRFALYSTAYITDTHRNYTRLNQVNGVNIGGTGVTWQVNNGATNAALLQGILHGTANTTHANGIRYGNNFQTFISTGLQVEARGVAATGGVQHELMGGVRWHEDIAKNTARQSNLIYEQVNGSLVFKSAAAATPTEGYARALSLWLGDRVRVGELTLLPLVRHERIESRANVDLPTSARNELSKTTFGLGSNLPLNDRWTLLAGVHQGFAPPGSNATEGSRGEESTNVEGGFRYRGSMLALDVVGFHTDYDNALRNCLVANPCANGDVLGVQQDGGKRVYGLETGATVLLAQLGGVGVPLQLSHTYTHGEYTRGADVASGVREGDVLDYTPAHIGRLGVGVEQEGRGGFHAGVNYSGGACVNTTCGREGVDTRFLRTESLLTVDLSGTVRVNGNVEFYGKVENLLDERKITHRGADGARGSAARYLATGLRITF